MNGERKKEPDTADEVKPGRRGASRWTGGGGKEEEARKAEVLS